MKWSLLFLLICGLAYTFGYDGPICCADNSCECAMCRLHNDDYSRFCVVDSDSCDAVIWNVKFRDIKARFDCEGPLDERVCDDTLIFKLPFDSTIIKHPVPKNREGKWICR